MAAVQISIENNFSYKYLRLIHPVKLCKIGKNPAVNISTRKLHILFEAMMNLPFKKPICRISLLREERGKICTLAVVQNVGFPQFGIFPLNYVAVRLCFKPVSKWTSTSSIQTSNVIDSCLYNIYFIYNILSLYLSHSYKTNLIRIPSKCCLKILNPNMCFPIRIISMSFPSLCTYWKFKRRTYN